MKETITIVTGGGSGLGFELSKLYVQIDNVCIVGRNKEKLKFAAKEIGAICTTHKVLCYQANIANENEVKALFANLEKYDVVRVINCAGAGKFGNPEDITAKMVDELIDSNLKSVMFMSANAIKAMKSNGGMIATVLSTAALKGNPQESVYCAVKWGARGYCEALKAAFKGTNIRIVTICPGGINTPFWKPDCGLTPNVEKFMNPVELAEVIFNTLANRKSLFCPDILIEKL